MHRHDGGNGRLDYEVDTMTEAKREQLQALLCQNFNHAEMQGLAAGIGIQLSQPANPVDRDLARELIQRADGHGRIHDLIEECYILRPGRRWGRFG